MLEFELRKAYETIKSLRGSLTKASDINTRQEEGEETVKFAESTVCILLLILLLLLLLLLLFLLLLGAYKASREKSSQFSRSRIFERNIKQTDSHHTFRREQ